MKELIRTESLPKHIAVIMDGNGRWAQGKGVARVFGHKNAIKAVREVTEGCAELGVEYLTLFAFSTENWNRPKLEVKALMELLVSTLSSEIKTLMDNDIRLDTIGDTSSLPEKNQRELAEAMNKTKDNKRMILVLALGYSGRWDLTQAMKRMAVEIENGKLNSDEIDQGSIEKYLNTSGDS